jgi:hypothetical protein
MISSGSSRAGKDRRNAAFSPAPVLDRISRASVTIDKASFRDVCKLVNSNSSAFLKCSKSIRARFILTICFIRKSPCMSHVEKPSSSLPRASTSASTCVMEFSGRSGWGRCICMAWFPMRAKTEEHANATDSTALMKTLKLGGCKDCRCSRGVLDEAVARKPPPRQRPAEGDRGARARPFWRTGNSGVGRGPHQVIEIKRKAR